MTDGADVVVVGGGIAGATLAGAVATAGIGVTVLEASTEFADRVRGESMQPWGVKEARDLGVEQVLLDAGAHVTPVWKQYMEGADDVRDIPMAMMVPGVAGSLNLRHPDTCQALLDAAVDAGATVVRGVRDVEIAHGKSPTVTYATDGRATDLQTTLVVGADGRAFDGPEAGRDHPGTSGADELHRGAARRRPRRSAERPRRPRRRGRRVLPRVPPTRWRLARVYLCTGVSGQHRFSGRTGTEQFLAACDVSCYPWREQVMAATPAGPCATYPGDDTWTDDAVRRWCRADRRRCRPQRPHHRPGALDRVARPRASSATSCLMARATRLRSLRTARNARHAWNVCDSPPTCSPSRRRRTPRTALPGTRCSPRRWRRWIRRSSR